MDTLFERNVTNFFWSQNITQAVLSSCFCNHDIKAKKRTHDKNNKVSNIDINITCLNRFDVLQQDVAVNEKMTNNLIQEADDLPT